MEREWIFGKLKDKLDYLVDMSFKMDVNIYLDEGTYKYTITELNKDEAVIEQGSIYDVEGLSLEDALDKQEQMMDYISSKTEIVNK